MFSYFPNTSWTTWFSKFYWSSAGHTSATPPWPQLAAF